MYPHEPNETIKAQIKLLHRQEKDEEVKEISNRRKHNIKPKLAHDFYSLVG